MKTLVLTGGPCAGKTSVIEALKPLLDDHVTFVPEVATMLFAGGFPVPGRNLEYDRADHLQLQRAIGIAQLTLEGLCAKMAAKRGHQLMICDRGLWDQAAYVDMEWEEYAELLSVPFDELEYRYDKVLHLQSLAVTAPELYQVDNNAVRYEIVETAIATDRKLQKVYARHHNALIIGDGVLGIADKARQVMHSIERLLHEK